MTAQISYAQACLALHRKIAERYGCSADALDDLAIYVVRISPNPAGLNGAAIIAHPQGETATAANVLVSYFGDVHPAWAVGDEAEG